MENIEKDMNIFLEEQGPCLDITLDEELLNISKKIYDFYKENNITDESELNSINKSINLNKLSSHIIVSLYLLVESGIILLNNKEKNSIKKVVKDKEIIDNFKNNINSYLTKYLYFLENNIKCLEEKIEETQKNIDRLKLFN